MLGVFCAFRNYLQQFHLLLYTCISITDQANLFLVSENSIFPIFPITKLPEAY